MKKQALRKIYLNKRKEISAAEKNKWEDLLLIQFQKLPIQIPQVIMTYAPIMKFNEFDPQIITDYCAFREPVQTLVYPVMNPESNTIHPVGVNDDSIFEHNDFGVDEPIAGENIHPQNIDMILVPLLAFDTQGYRVGYGKGYYDRFLQTCRKDVITIGFSFFEPIPNIEDRGEHDVRLNYCITTKQFYTF